MDILKRKDGENDFEYGLRIIEAKCEKVINLDWQEIVDLLELKCNKDSLRKACNVTQFSAYNVMKYYKNLIEQAKINGNDSESFKELIKELDDKKVELEKEKIRFQDQKREYRNYLRADARFEHLKETLTNEISKLNELKPLVFDGRTTVTNGNHAVVMLSDWHVGLEEHNHWNKFNKDILRERVKKLEKKIINICKLHNIEKLHMELLGDLVNGLIHVTTRISNEEDVIQQIILCSEVLSGMICNLAKEIPNIEIYSSTGNHGRCVANAKESLDTENFEKLITWYLKARLSNVKNIKFNENKYDDNIIVYKFLNEVIFAVHGHEDKINTAVSELSKMMKIFPTELHMGHYHSYYEKDSHDISTVVNGTLSGVDKFAKHIRKTSKPTQVCMIYNNDGRECTYKIKLD